VVEMEPNPMRTCLIAIALLFIISPAFALQPPAGVALEDGAKSVVLLSGDVRAEISKSSGDILSFTYKGKSLFERESYFDWVAGSNNHLRGTFSLRVDPKTNNGEMAEVVITQKYGGQGFPCDVELHHVMRRGETGIYSFAIFNHKKEYPDCGIAQSRQVFRPDGRIFDYLAVDDQRQRIMPPPETPSKVLGPKEAHIVTEGPFKGFIEDKYHWFADAGEHFVHGWASTKENIGVWILYGSNESRNGGPTKQHNTAHGGPTLLQLLFCGHYGSGGLHVKAGEEWQKVYGPWMLYANSGSDVKALWADAKKKATAEMAGWPYSWMKNDLYPLESARGSVSGTLTIADPQDAKASPANAWVGLAQPLSSGLEWQKQAKGYQFWVRADNKGQFRIPHVRPGRYTVYAFTDGVMDEYSKDDIVVEAGKTVDLGTIKWVPKRYGRELWQIGTPDRTAREFRHGDDYRKWGLWLEYPKDFPNDVNFTIGKSDPAKDWNYSQMTREVDGSHIGTKWRVNFDIKDMPEKPQGQAVLRIAFAAAQNAEVLVSLNDEHIGSTGRLGDDNAMVRAGIHGQYVEKDFTFNASLLKNGTNTIVLNQRVGGTMLKNVMYDCIRLEVPF
jgi:rhamnogalacturonan endolyase